MKKVLFIILLFITSLAVAKTEYVIQQTIQDKIFLIKVTWQDIR